MSKLNETPVMFDREGVGCGVLFYTFPCSVEDYDFSGHDLVLLYCQQKGTSVHYFLNEEQRKRADEKYPVQGWEVFIFMLVKWNGAYTERLGIGKIQCKAWNSVEFKIKEILLA
jgi:hypothetical protein